MTRRRMSSLILVSIFLTITTTIGLSAEETAPAVLVMPGTVGEGAAVGDLDAVDAVGMYLSATGKVDVITFDIENPTIARYIMERKLGDDYLDKIAEPQTAKEIAGLLKADYILSVHAEIRPNAALVALRLAKTSGRGEWTSGAESGIAQGEGPSGAINRKNAINTAASSAVSQIDIAAFDKLQPKSTFVVVDAPTATTAVATPVEEPSTRNLVAELTSHMNAAEAYAKRDDRLNAIYELRQAVNIEPKTVSLRLKLADAYSALGMTEEAIDELKRALLFKSDDPVVCNALAQLYLSNGALKQAGDWLLEVVKIDAGNVDARISLGNLYWNQNKLDEAASVFEEAARLDPTNAVPHERLYKLYWARKNYALAVEHLIASESGSGESDPVARYKLVAGVIRAQFDDILQKLDETWKEYQDQQIIREDYYRDCTDLSSRIDGLAAFLSTQTAPDGLKAAHSHGVLCASLLSESAVSMISYLETDKQQYSEQAGLYREEAKAELEQFDKGIGAKE